MYRASGEESPPNAREPSSLPPENSTWHRDPCNRDLRTDKMDRDRVGAGNRHWIGDPTLSMTSFQGITSGAPLSGNHFVPRSKPRFQGMFYPFILVRWNSFFSFISLLEGITYYRVLLRFSLSRSSILKVGDFAFQDIFLHLFQLVESHFLLICFNV